MNLCKDCKNFRPNVVTLGGKLCYNGQPVCAAVCDKVYGTPLECHLARTRSHECGPEGRMFEARPEGEENLVMQFWVSRDQTSSVVLTEMK